MMERILQALLPPESDHPDNPKARLLGGVLIVSLALGFIFDLALTLTKSDGNYAHLLPKIVLYPLLGGMLWINKWGWFRTAAYTCLLVSSLFGFSLFYFGGFYDPAFCSILVISMAGILLGPMGGLLILGINLALWLIQGIWGDAFAATLPHPEKSFPYDALNLFLYGLVILALQIVVGHFLQMARAKLEKARQVAEEATAAKSKFLAQMSHELRTPVSGVIGLLSLTLKKDLPPAAREEIAQALRQAEIQLTLINDLLDLAKVEAGHAVLESIAFDPRQLLDESLFPLRQMALQKGLRFSAQASETLPAALVGDPMRLRQILLNLVGNAVKFTPSGSVTVTWESHHHAATSETMSRITVADTGIGIRPEDKDRIFTPFEQGEASTTRRFGGTGLGLGIARNLAHAMGGEIQLRSVYGKGTSFHFQFPLITSDSRPPKVSVEKADAQPLYRLRVLLVEDVPTNSLIAKALLGSLGQQVDVAGDGYQACVKLSELRYDLILMDMRMPVMDGQEAAKHIRAGGLENFPVLDPKVYIVALTANNSEGDRQACLAAGMDGFLTKPLREPALRGELNKAAAYQKSRDVVLPLPEADASSGWIAAPAAENPSHELEKMWPKEAAQRLDKLRRALARGDRGTLAREAHNLKGSAAYLELQQLGSMAAHLEKAADGKAEKSELEKWVAAIEVCVSISLAKTEIRV